MTSLLNFLNDYSALITALGTLILAGITWWNIRADRNSRRIDKEKDIAIKLLNNMLLLISYINIHKSKKQAYTISEQNHLLYSEKFIKENDDKIFGDSKLSIADKLQFYSSHFSNYQKEAYRRKDDILYYGNKIKDLVAELNSNAALMPNEIKIILEEINVYTDEFDVDEASKVINTKEFKKYIPEIQLNLQNILHDKKFSLAKFKWKKLKS